MPEKEPYRDTLWIAIARTLILAASIALVFASATYFLSGEPWVGGVGFGTLGLVADALVARAAGARGRRLLGSVAATAAVWFGFGTFYIVTMSQAWMLTQPIAALPAVLCAAAAAVGLLPRTQAVWAWALASIAAMSLTLHGGPAVNEALYVSGSIALSAASIGAVGLYIRGASARRLGWRTMGWRLALLASAVAFSVLVATSVAVYVGNVAVTWSSTSGSSARSQFALNASLELSEVFPESRLATESPSLRGALLRYAALGDVGLTVYDLDAKRIVVAIRRTPVDDGRQLGYASVGIGAAAAEEIANAASGAPVSAGSYSPPLSVPLGSPPGQDGATPASRTPDPTYLVVNPEVPTGTRFALVASDADQGREDAGLVGYDTLSRQMGTKLAPWLILAFMLPCSLGLIALDRRDEARGRLRAAEERARLNRDAHDRVYNRLTALANGLAADEVDTGAGPAPSVEIRRTVAELQSILGNGGMTSYPAADDAAASLVSDACADQGRLWGMEVGLEGAEALHGIDPRTGWELLCVVEEALANAGRHGGATRADVRLSRDADLLLLEVRDNGRGITAPLADDGLPAAAGGLRGIAERARALGGTLELVTGAGGTTIRARIPVA
jgi:signal transduction histidine kinase